MGVKLLAFGAKEPGEKVTYYIDLSNYGGLTFISASSVVYASTDKSRVDLPEMHPYTPTITGSRVYQTLVSGSSAASYVWAVRVQVSGSNDLYSEQGTFSVREI
jgi:hypothetical protein